MIAAASSGTRPADHSRLAGGVGLGERLALVLLAPLAAQVQDDRDDDDRRRGSPAVPR